MLEGRVAVLTGAAGGIGRVVAKQLVGAGARIALLDIDLAGCEQLAVDLGRNDALPVACDISDWQQCERAVREVNDRFGSIHILINNGALGMGSIRADHLPRSVKIEEISPEVWTSFVGVNLSGAFFMTRAVLPFMKEQRWGRLINVTTSFFTMLRRGFAPYGPAKAGLEAWSAGLAVELEGSGITVNVVVPGGAADTAMHPPEAGFKRADLIRPEVMGPPIIWLCSDEGGSANNRRYIAARWRTSVPPIEAEAACGAPIGWPELTLDPVWPGGRPSV